MDTWIYAVMFVILVVIVGSYIDSPPLDNYRDCPKCGVCRYEVANTTYVYHNSESYTDPNDGWTTYTRTPVTYGYRCSRCEYPAIEHSYTESATHQSRY